MANFICEFEGVRGRNLKLYDTKIIITTKKTVGSLITGNFTDGEKTIYLRDVVGVQFKKSGGLIGYLQFETPSMQMNNKSDNMFSENTFTYENGKNGITNELMIALYEFVTDRIEELKYTTSIINETPDFEAMKVCEEKSKSKAEENVSQSQIIDNKPQPKSTICKCGERFYGDICPNCGRKAIIIQSTETRDNLRKATQCECGELHYAKYCPICGKKAGASISNTEKPLKVEDKPQPKSNICQCGERFYGDTCPNCGRKAIIIQSTETRDNLRKATQCECGELHYARYCPICGKKAGASISNTEKPLKVEDKPQPKSTVCKCGERFYGDICPNCGRKVKDI